MLRTSHFLNLADEGVIGEHGHHLIVLVLCEANHLNVTAEANDFLAHFMFEAEHHSQTHQHDCHTDGYTEHGYTNSRTGKPFPVLCFIRINSFGYEKFERHR